MNTLLPLASQNDHPILLLSVQRRLLIINKTSTKKKQDLRDVGISYDLKRKRQDRVQNEEQPITSKQKQKLLLKEKKNSTLAAQK